MLEVKVPGKMFIAGEYQVVKPQGSAVLVSVDKYITITIRESKNYGYKTNISKYKFSYYNKIITFEKNHNNKIVKSAITTAFNYIEYLKKDIKTFYMDINSELQNKENIKYGFGSSGAITIAILKSILSFHQIDFNNEIIFKLSVISQIRSNNISSGADLACSIYEGYVYYERYDIDWVLNNYKDFNIVTKDWPLLKIEKLNSKLEYNVFALWTKEAYKTKSINKKISQNKIDEAYNIVYEIKKSIINGNRNIFSQNLKEYQKWLEENIFKNTNLYTERLKDSVKISTKYNLPSKVSGAGGGDCSISFYKKDFKQFDKYIMELEKYGIKPIVVKMEEDYDN